MDTEQELVSALLEHNKQFGGSRVLSYGGMEVYAPVDDIKQAIERLTHGDRRKIMASVNAALALRFPKVKKGTASQKVAMECCQDIAIWFANEVIEGRATLELQ